MVKQKRDNDLNNSQVTLTSYINGEGNFEANPALGRNGIDNFVLTIDEKDVGKVQGEKCHGCAAKELSVLQLAEGKFRRRSTIIQPTIKEWLKTRTSKACSKKLLYKRIPILTWLPKYNLQCAVSDLVAGITVGLTVIPQAIAYSNVANLPPQVGLYSSFMACFVYTIFGSCKDSPIGPTAIMGLMTKENNHGFGVDGAVLLCFLSGCVEFLMGMLQLGFLIDFISGPVSIGFTSAAAIIIATTQIKNVLGLKIAGGSFVVVWEQLFEHITETRVWDTVLGISCMVILFLLRVSLIFYFLLIF